MNARDDLANASLDASLLTQIGDVFAGLANDNTSIFCADEGTKSQGIVGGW